MLFVLIISLTSCNSSSTKDENTKEKSLYTEDATTLFSKIVPDNSGISFTNRIIQTNDFNFSLYEYIYTGSGVAVLDYNNDGWQDLYFVSNFGPNRLYKNNGDLSFTDVTTVTKTEDYQGFSTGVSVLDVNQDGWMDLYVSKAGSLRDHEARRNLLFINQKDGTFTEEAKKWGVDYPGFTTQAYPLDYDHDGDMDLYLVNHRNDFKNASTISGAIQSQIDPLTSDQLYRNDSGKFTNVTNETGLYNKTWGLSAVVSDFNEDGWDDIYVCNDFSEPDVLYINQQNGTFRNTINTSLKHISYNSMGSDFADLNNDLAPDLITVDMLSDNYARSKENMASMNIPLFRNLVKAGYHHAYMANMLHINTGKGTFTETGQMSGVTKTDWSWAPLLADFDNDGLKDIFVTNGVDREYNNQDARAKVKKISDTKTPVSLEAVLNMYPSQPLVNHIYKNNGNLKFEKAMSSWGMDHKTFSYGAAYADLDNDGDLEIITNNLNEPASIYKNNSNNNFISIVLKGAPQNPMALGTEVYVTTENSTQTQRLYLARGYESSVSSVLNFGLGKDAQVKNVQIKWPDGKVSTITNPAKNKRHTVAYNTAENKTIQLPTKKNFKNSVDASEMGLKYTHKENPVDDYNIQLLLPQNQSTKGTGMTKADVNADGLEDFFVGNAAGAPASLYIQKENGTFSESNKNLWNTEAKYEDANALFLDADTDGDQDLYVVSAGYELEEDSPLLQDRLYINDGKGNFTKNTMALPAMLTAGKAVTAADIDGDGDLDIFVGGNVIPKKYPLAPNSYLLINENGTFKDITPNNAGLQKPGMVSDALFTDYDGDNDKDLLLVGEWMAPTIFENTEGSFQKIEVDAFSKKEGWWFSATAADVDKDGDIDYFFGNLGDNNKFKPSEKKPVYIYSKDFDNNGSYDIALSKKNDGKIVPVRGKECSSQQTPYLLEKIKSYKEFASLDMEGIYGEEKLEDAHKLTAYTFNSAFALNNGDGTFTFSPLPNQAQLGPTLSMLVEDFNNDGNLDIMGVGAIYDAEVETVRYDSNYGYVLLGQGNGNFRYTESYAPFVTTDAKDLLQVRVNNTPVFMVASNNGPLEVFSYHP
ncbi:VCBS repeat-containing protein [Marinirhabdus gelatinilytica]|nr:VCBS repeat-containing protein [Marinirhabdus gelatinilytica]